MIPIKCFDVVSVLVDDANDKFKPLWTYSEEKYNILKQYCGIIDRIAENTGAIAYGIEVGEIDMTVRVSVGYDKFQINIDENSDFYKLLPHTVSFGASFLDDDGLYIDFVFPSIWERNK